MVRAWLHEPASPGGDGLVVTHGAGSNCDTHLLKTIASTFSDAGFTVLRCDLPFRQVRPTGPPLGSAAKDREGLRRAVEALREIAPGRMLLGGHSYGGRQATMLAAELPGLADALLLLSYPLHPARQPAKLRTEHFPGLRTPSVFIQGTRDGMGSMDEMQAALALIPAQTLLVPVKGAGHSLNPDIAPVILRETVCFVNALNKSNSGS
jgi:uncharacterized protein